MPLETKSDVSAFFADPVFCQPCSITGARLEGVVTGVFGPGVLEPGTSSKLGAPLLQT